MSLTDYNTIVLGESGEGKTTFLNVLCSIWIKYINNLQLIIAGEEREYLCFRNIPNVHLIALEKLDDDETLLSATLKKVEAIIDDRTKATKEEFKEALKIIAVVDGLYGERDSYRHLLSMIKIYAEVFDIHFVIASQSCWGVSEECFDLKIRLGKNQKGERGKEMKIEYESYMDAISNETVKKAWKTIFDDFFPDIIDRCEDERTSFKLFISLSEMVKEVQKSNIEVSKEDYIFYQVFPEFSDVLINLLTTVPDESKYVAYEVLNKVITATILELIAAGVEKGILSVDDFQ